MPSNVTLAEVLKAASEALSSGLRCALPGRVESYVPATQTAAITPTIRNPIRDIETGEYSSEELPTIPNVPVCFPRGGGFHVTFPLEKGDHVLLVFADLATGQWRASGETSEPLDVRRHSLGYPFAIPGAFSDLQTLTNPINPLLLGKLVVGKEASPAQCIRISGTTIEVGGLVPLPLAMGPATVTALTAISVWASAISALVPGSAAATAILTTALATAATAIPATITKGQ